MKRFALPAVLVAIGLVLFSTAIPGTFLIDEHAYISTIAGLRDGAFRLSATADLPPSPELLSFDAAPRSRALAETPASPNTPPLYAVIALPFSYFGVRGLIALQVIAFLVCAGLVFRIVRRETSRTDLAWLSLGVFGLGGFAIEYAMGIWPHTLTMALVTGAVDVVSRLRHGELGARRVAIYAAIAGACVGLAAGIRYQNIAVAATLPIALWWARHRRLALAGYVLGAAIPLLACSFINASRLGTWNPVSKGWRYLEVSRNRSTAETVEQMVTSTYARVVDFTAWAPAAGEPPKAESGAFVLRSGIKKALLQSAPWTILPLLALLAAWLVRTREDNAHRAGRRPLLRGFAIVTGGVLGMFALYGFRSDGWCYNQRYLLELVPMFVVTLAIVLVDWRPRWFVLAAGVAAGGVLGAVIVHASETVGGQIAMMKVPLVLALVLGALWLLRARAPAAFTMTLGLALGWSAMIHVIDDVPASREIRTYNGDRLARGLAALPDDGRPIALFAYARAKDAYGPLLLARDIVIIDPWIDDGHDAPMLLEHVLRQGRTVYLDRAMPRELLAALTSGRRVAESVHFLAIEP